MGGTCGSVIVSSAPDVLWMSVVRGMRGDGEVCDMCMCLARVASAWVDERIWFGFTNYVGAWGVLDVCLCLCCGGVGSG